MQYIWLIWSLLLLVIWAVIYFSLKTLDDKKRMLVVSFWTSLTGLTEPLFVPEYWSPPSLFNLNMLTGFDIESIIWAFGVGGIAVVVYNWIFRVSEKKMFLVERHSFHHRHHLATLLAMPIILLILLIATPLNSLHSAIIAMTLGGLAAWYCRPDLKKKMFVSAFLFFCIYFVYFLTLIAMSPGYVERVWNLEAISGILILGIPLEELLFALSFGFMWSSVYEHLTWRRLKN
ncbi:hypothetical protein A3H53_03810 [Candidatus Nomurabacteria bacterium RIFCSPLOWO2_02_FULL_40_10]|uniref:Lycopene cyclase domain-containing protein n=2 Tax=Candidatus Nomuraibacteriota TaxID=1752729 RepID=A0A1F6XW45_9BACT|nr:MAG: hypothetical protein A2642_01270 [Candidatus Nomurabacteria bacterium RIFCSPHIGHO2_01_FULL_39_10]OGI98238.1 MAG: hypothetical protein A3H53_03810 [Candidatus Nomurabacteria bacterium RIFCSPLOWO2_02_FULL_40_10]